MLAWVRGAYANAFCSPDYNELALEMSRWSNSHVLCKATGNEALVQRLHQQVQECRLTLYSQTCSLGRVPFNNYILADSNAQWHIRLNWSEERENCVMTCFEGAPQGSCLVVRDSIIVDDDMLQRIHFAMAANNFSVFQRNGEHVMNWIVDARWTSPSSTSDNMYWLNLRNRARGICEPDVVPQDVIDQMEVQHTPLANHHAYLNHKSTRATMNLEENSREKCINVLLIGLTGAGKSALINAIFGKQVTRTSALSISTTKHILFIQGTGELRTQHGNHIRREQRKFCLIDSIGFNDAAQCGGSVLDNQQVAKILQDRIHGSVAVIHKVVVMLHMKTGDGGHRAVLEPMLDFLGYANGKPGASFLHLYNDFQGQSDAEQKRNEGLLIQQFPECKKRLHVSYGPKTDQGQPMPGAEKFYFPSLTTIRLRRDASRETNATELQPVIDWLLYDDPHCPGHTIDLRGGWSCSIL